MQSVAREARRATEAAAPGPAGGGPWVLSRHADETQTKFGETSCKPSLERRVARSWQFCAPGAVLSGKDGGCAASRGRFLPRLAYPTRKILHPEPRQVPAPAGSWTCGGPVGGASLSLLGGSNCLGHWRTGNISNCNAAFFEFCICGRACWHAVTAKQRHRHLMRSHMGLIWPALRSDVLLRAVLYFLQLCYSWFKKRKVLGTPKQ